MLTLVSEDQCRTQCMAEEPNLTGCKTPCGSKLFSLKASPQTETKTISIGMVATRYKAKLVGHAISKIEVIDYLEMFGFVIKFTYVRMVLSVAAVKDLASTEWMQLLHS